MRCFFFKNGHIVAAAELGNLSHEETKRRARLLFEEQRRDFDGFEVWDHARMVYQFLSHPVQLRK